MTEEIAAVPSADSAPYLGGGPVSDEEFDSWVKRSQDQADAVMADWDGSVEFERRELEPDPPPMDTEAGPGIASSVVEMPGWAQEYMQARFAEPSPAVRQWVVSTPRRNGRSHLRDSVMDMWGEWDRATGDARDRLRRSREARTNLTALGFVVVDAEAVPRSSGLILPSDDAVAWARRTFAVPTQREIVPPDNVHLSPYSYFCDPVTYGQPQRRATFNAFPEW